MKGILQKCSESKLTEVQILQVGLILVPNLSNHELFWRGKNNSSLQNIEFLNYLLDFLENLLEFIFA